MYVGHILSVGVRSSSVRGVVYSSEEIKEVCDVNGISKVVAVCVCSVRGVNVRMCNGDSYRGASIHERRLLTWKDTLQSRRNIWKGF